MQVIKSAIFAMVLMSPISTSHGEIDDDRIPLQEQDWQELREWHAKGPSLSSGLYQEHQWESYAQWHCLDMRTVETACVDIYYGGPKQSAILTVLHNGRVVQFTDAPESHEACDEIMDVWQQLLHAQEVVCIMNAKHEQASLDYDLHYIIKLKTHLGSWEPQFYRITDDDRGDDEYIEQE